ncbi:mediator of RNA polymerase II transcription subunit 21-like isoform X3 [Olea europaea var. sylvestris]|uniref:mediator of RNA polymerase II transcription subunit 21-like isoform X3 n=1 Tax=Olea europaea var. sylvestris TaxID=158386 RepID=UPI000C1D0CB0|nr:mediator of RNA polymerase II transcription subunit 21-like isoform X3 [Olea europaea var. sylvestris]
MSINVNIFRKFGQRKRKMDIISQLQEQVNTIAALSFNIIGTLQRDAPPVRLSPNYPEPPKNANDTEETTNLAEQPKTMSSELVKAAKQFDVLVAAIPLSDGDDEAAQLKRIAELQNKFTGQAENDAIGQELQKQLDAAGLCNCMSNNTS